LSKDPHADRVVICQQGDEDIIDVGLRIASSPTGGTGVL
jgi:hypothetical protein